MATYSPAVPVEIPGTHVHDWHAALLWAGGAAILGFGASALFSGVMELSRNWFLVPYFAVAIPYLLGYLRWTGVSLWSVLTHRWMWGLAGAAVLSIFMVVNILNEPASARSEGLTLVGNILWLGVAYGIVDALLLTVLPVSAIWLAFRATGHTDKWSEKILAGTLALAASLAVTAAYHVGYVEFRNAEVVSPLFGNGLMSLGYILTANPLTAIFAHVALHVTSVLHGIDTTVTLPPHY